MTMSSYKPILSFDEEAAKEHDERGDGGLTPTLRRVACR